MIARERTACFRMIALAAALTVGGAAAQAATPLYWPSSDYGYDRPLYDNSEPPRRRVIRQPQMPKDEAAKAEKMAQGVGKPTGPLVMAISIERQTMKVYDANGLFAETPISSGMKGHSTPMGAFSVIQKNKWHRSNIYSGAPMPYMQRLTWSGIALHAGIVPGHPASHGCVRMPMAFAVKMWSWTRMGARVVITPGEISPASITHPLLASLKAPTLPVAQAPVATSPAANTKTADASGAMPAAAISDAPATVAPTEPPAIAVTEPPAAVSGETKHAIIEKPADDKLSANTPAPGKTAETPKFDQAPVVDVPPVAATKRGSPIAILVSRKDAKLYVRQNFAPLFDVPVTISGDQPLGTHVFTAFADKDATKPVHWTALSLPASARMDETVLSRRWAAGAIVTTPPLIEASAMHALDRLKLPDDVLAKLGDQISTGSSLVISDQGITASGETGLGTDFIIRLR